MPGEQQRLETVADARTSAYDAVGRIRFEGMRYRSDIAEAAAGGATLSLHASSER